MTIFAFLALMADEFRLLTLTNFRPGKQLQPPPAYSDYICETWN